MNIKGDHIDEKEIPLLVSLTKGQVIHKYRVIYDVSVPTVISSKGHKLTHYWDLWTTNSLDKIYHLTSFNTIEEFWSIQNNLPKLDEVLNKEKLVEEEKTIKLHYKRLQRSLPNKKVCHGAKKKQIKKHRRYEGTEIVYYKRDYGVPLTGALSLASRMVLPFQRTHLRKWPIEKAWNNFCVFVMCGTAKYHDVYCGCSVSVSRVGYKFTVYYEPWLDKQLVEKDVRENLSFID